MKNKIVVVEATSTAFGYLEDIRELGYEPVILESYLPDGYARRTLDKERKVKYSHISYPITLIRCWSYPEAKRASSPEHVWQTILAWSETHIRTL